MQVSRVDKDMLLPPKVVLVLAPQAARQEEMCENAQFRKSGEECGGCSALEAQVRISFQ